MKGIAILAILCCCCSLSAAATRDKRFLQGLGDTLTDQLRTFVSQTAKNVTKLVTDTVSKKVNQVLENGLGSVMNATKQVLSGTKLPSLDNIPAIAPLLNKTKKFLNRAGISGDVASMGEEILNLGRGCLATWKQNIGRPSSLDLSCLLNGTPPPETAMNLADMPQGSCHRQNMGASTVQVCRDQNNMPIIDVLGTDPVCITYGPGTSQQVCETAARFTAQDTPSGQPVFLLESQDRTSQAHGQLPNGAGSLSRLSVGILCVWVLFYGGQTF